MPESSNIVLNYSRNYYEQKISALENYSRQLEQHLNTLVDKYNEKEYCFSEGMLDRVVWMNGSTFLRAKMRWVSSSTTKLSTSKLP